MQSLKRGVGLVKERIHKRELEIGRTGSAPKFESLTTCRHVRAYFILSVLLFITARGNDWRGNALSK